MNRGWIIKNQTFFLGGGVLVTPYLPPRLNAIIIKYEKIKISNIAKIKTNLKTPSEWLMTANISHVSQKVIQTIVAPFISNLTF